MTRRRHALNLALLVAAVALMFGSILATPPFSIGEEPILERLSRDHSKAAGRGEFHALMRDWRSAGRFQPAMEGFWILRYRLTGADARWLSATSALLLLVTAVALYGTAILLGAPPVAALLGALAVTLQSGSAEVFGKLLYTAELVEVPLLALATWALVFAAVGAGAKATTRFAAGAAAAGIALALFSKETAVAILGGIGAGALAAAIQCGMRDRTTVVLLRTFVAALILAAIWFVSRIASGVGGGGWYTQLYVLDPARMVINAGKLLVLLLAGNGPLPLIVLGLAAVMLWRRVRGRDPRADTTWLAFALGSALALAVIYLPWPYPVVRYMGPPFWFLVLTATLVLPPVWAGSHAGWRATIAALLVCAFTTTIVRTVNLERWLHILTTTHTSLIARLAALEGIGTRQVFIALPSPPPQEITSISVLLAERAGLDRVATVAIPQDGGLEAVVDGDIVLLPSREGDGHMNSDIRVDSALNQRVRKRWHAHLRPLMVVGAAAHTVTVYWEAPIYNLLQGSAYQPSESVMSRGPRRNFIHSQQLALQWDVFEWHNR